MAKMHVQIPEGDLAALRQLAAEQGVSVAELVRRGVRKVLDGEGKPSREELLRRARAVAGKYSSGKPDLGLRHDDYLHESLAADLGHAV